jgi:hypothetical protein
MAIRVRFALKRRPVQMNPRLGLMTEGSSCPNIRARPYFAAAM